MHEVGIADEIKAIVLEKLKENKASKVKKIKLIIGELTSIVPDALTFAFEVVSKETPLEGVKVEIKVVKMKGRCKKCGREFTIEDFNYICPECKNADIKLIAGKEMILHTIDME